MVIPSILKLLLLYFSSSFAIASTTDTLTFNSSISDIKGENLVSPNGKFILGFFTPNYNGSSQEDKRRYLGIWYSTIKPRTLVWVANRKESLTSDICVFGISSDAKLKLHSIEFWSPPRPFERNNYNMTLKLMDTGNLILYQQVDPRESDFVLWQSFDHPTDTFLPGMKMDQDMKLISWTSPNDPAEGDFTFQLEEESQDQYKILNRTAPCWKSEVEGFVNFNQMLKSFLQGNLTTHSWNVNYTIGNKSRPISPQLSTDTRVVMQPYGELQYLIWSNMSESWSIRWKKPSDKCSLLDFCGTFGICSYTENNEPVCKCLPGFIPLEDENGMRGDFSKGCTRKTEICEGGDSSKDDRFLNLLLQNVKKSGTTPEKETEQECRSACLDECKCQAYSYSGERGTTTTCRLWTEDLQYVQKYNGRDRPLNMSLRVQPSDLTADTSRPEGEKKRENFSLSLFIILMLCITFVVITCSLIYIWYSKRRNAPQREVYGETSGGNAAFYLYNTEQRIQNLMLSTQFKEEDKKGIDVPCFSFESILAATENFSEKKKIGQGGFGPVYKGTFPGEQIIAIKRLSSGSGQGLEEFMNEVTLIAKLQHRNLVRLLGYCVEGDEKMLLYEFMTNKSLDSFIFDRTLCLLLNWETRFNIIMGIARGLLYLHQDSRLRIIHRDLKTSNILLDEEMNPKISDFGLARIFGGKQTEASTNRVVGTYGYMSPEYALDGFFSVKSDVFSFGVVVLEIISGKKNTGFYQSEQALSLLGYAWKLWTEEKALDLVDQTVQRTCDASQVWRCVNVGLLCVQEDPNDRPTMSAVVFLLGGENATLPRPRQPAFVVRRSSLSGSASTSSGKPEIFMDSTSTLHQGR